MTVVDAARAWARENGSTFENQLFDLLRIPSISAESQHKGDVLAAAEWIAANLKAIGAEHVQVIATPGHPIVYGDWLHAPGAKTVLIYGHYDVQPAQMSDGWHTDPFEPVVKDNIVYARGSSDDKGQMFIHIKALEAYLKTNGGAPVNVKFLLEGEEEISSKNLMAFLQANQELLAADVCVISDSGSFAIESPAIVTSVRGISYMEIHVQGPATDLHSGGYGGIVHNPALALAQIIAKMHNADNSVAVPGFYDDVVQLTPADRDNLMKTDISEAALKGDTQVPQSWGEAGYTLRERLGARPTLEINGILSGWTGEGSKTVLPAKAMAKVSCRLVANQHPERIYELVRDYVASITPPTVTSRVVLLNKGEPALIDPNIPEMQAAFRAYASGWGSEPVFLREGGSIPIVVDIQRVLGMPVIMMGYGLNNDGAHGPDEHYSLEMFHRGIQTAICFLGEMAT
ncbi:MAG: dipeptidase [Pleurocapsa minor GSE-CHR-MK-17-07R]|jgi:acetylornithine deacetylase/succinyl-diaminopimelate desuccinylase-like protein|nr:dipeptidase [Pleurocapsa minor GSE-CHR-MK 17-07R]